MKCFICHSVFDKIDFIILENYCNLKNFSIHNIKREVCTSCNEEIITIKKISFLHKKIAEAIIRKKMQMSAEEFTFLRKQFRLSESELANILMLHEDYIHSFENRSSDIPFEICEQLKAFASEVLNVQRGEAQGKNVNFYYINEEWIYEITN